MVIDLIDWLIFFFVMRHLFNLIDLWKESPLSVLYNIHGAWQRLFWYNRTVRHVLFLTQYHLWCWDFYFVFIISVYFYRNKKSWYPGLLQSYKLLYWGWTRFTSSSRRSSRWNTLDCTCSAWDCNIRTAVDLKCLVENVVFAGLTSTEINCCISQNTRFIFAFSRHRSMATTPMHLGFI